MVTHIRKFLPSLGALTALIILPLFFKTDDYVMNILILCLIWGVMAQSWDLILGVASLFSFGHLSFFIIGAYACGLFGVYLGVSPWLGYLLGGIVAALIGFIIGIPCLRLQGMYLAIVTFSLQFVLPTLIVYFGPGRIEGFSTGGTFGLVHIPSPSLIGYTLNRNALVPWYYLALLFFILCMVVIYAIIRSPVGKAFVALRDAEPLAKTLGINEYKYKLMVFAISAFIAGVAGAVYATYFQVISPASMTLDVFLIDLVMVLFGGLGVFPGAAIGAFVITIINELLRPALAWRLVILGMIIILTMIFMPKGLMGVPDMFREGFRRLSKGRKSNKAVASPTVRD